jgi:aconitase B
LPKASSPSGSGIVAFTAVTGSIFIPLAALINEGLFHQGLD